MENAMYKHAQDLEFEEAGKLRDEMERIRALTLGTG
jgi:excinuclease ABC subunit B